MGGEDYLSAERQVWEAYATQWILLATVCDVLLIEWVGLLH